MVGQAPPYFFKGGTPSPLVSFSAQSFFDLAELSGKVGIETLPEESAVRIAASNQSPVRGLNHAAEYLPLGRAPESVALGQSFSKYNRKRSFSAVRAQ